MANPSGFPREYNVILYRRGTAGTITYRGNASSRVVDYSLKFVENYPKVLTLILSNGDTTSTVNLLNASCAQWSDSVTGALSLGDRVRFGLYQSDGNTVDVLFKGNILKIENMASGQIKVVAYDFLKRLDYIKKNYSHYATIRDRYAFEVTKSNGLKYLTGVTDADISYPLIEVEFASDDTRLSLAGGAGGPSPPFSGYNIATSADYFVAQSFIAEGDAFLGIRFSFSHDADYYNTGDTLVDIDLCADDNGVPGAVIATETWTYSWPVGPDAASWTEEDVSFVNSNFAIPIQTGQKYWIKFRRGMAPQGATPECYIAQDTKDSDYDNGALYYTDSTGSGYDATDFLAIDIDCGIYSPIDSDEFAFDDTSDRIYILSDLETNTVDSYYGSYYRGRATYYYGTITLEDIVKRLIRINNSYMLGNVSANLDRTFKYYNPRGKTMGEAMRELMDLYETSGSWKDYQHVMAHYTDGSSIENCKVGKRLKSTDTPAYILSYAADTANADEHIIMGLPNLLKSNAFRHAAVELIGTDQEGRPIPVYRHDRALATSLFNQTDGMVETMFEQDNGYINVTDLEAAAYQALGSVIRDQWEGDIRLSGQHLLWDWDTTSDTYGSGKIVTLNWSPLGISDVDLKVKEVELGPNTTSIRVTNADDIRSLLYRYTRGGIERLDSTASPEGYPMHTYGTTHVNNTISESVAGTIYMELKDASNVLLTGLVRVKCTVTSDTTTNLKVIRGVFETYNGYSTAPVRYVNLYNAISGGAVITNGNIDLYRTVSSIEVDERVDKFKGTRLTFEVTCKAS